MSENATQQPQQPAAAAKQPSALRFALLWFGIPLLLFLVLAFFTRE